MPEPLLLIGTDACVLIEAVRLGERHPSGFLLLAAREHVFRLLLIAQAESEAQRAVGAGLDEVLDGCLIDRRPNPSTTEIEAIFPQLCPHIRHVNDIPLAVAVRLAAPDYFVSSNTAHWRPSLGPLLGGVSVMSPRRMLAELGVHAPPRRSSRPR